MTYLFYLVMKHIYIFPDMSKIWISTIGVVTALENFMRRHSDTIRWQYGVHCCGKNINFLSISLLQPCLELFLLAYNKFHLLLLFTLSGTHGCTERIIELAPALRKCLNHFILCSFIFFIFLIISSPSRSYKISEFNPERYSFSEILVDPKIVHIILLSITMSSF